LNDILYKIIEDIEETLENKIDKISILLDNKSETFTSSLKENSNETINKLKTDLENMEASRQRDITLINKITNLKEGL
jgi:polyhydroxyalkanoate synthesis regulator phasin